MQLCLKTYRALAATLLSGMRLGLEPSAKAIPSRRSVPDLRSAERPGAVREGHTTFRETAIENTLDHELGPSTPPTLISSLALVRTNSPEVERQREGHFFLFC